MSTIEEIYAAMSRLPAADRLRLLERVLHDLTGGQAAPVPQPGAPGTPLSLIGAWESDADVVDDLIETLMVERETRTLRTGRG